VKRVEALALLQSLNNELLINDSATLTLDQWCENHKLASPARVVAERVRGKGKIATQDQRKLLNVSEAEPVKYRKVHLRCGEHILSEADNWYVPSRLTSEMNETLDNTDVPFGRVVQPLHFRRQRLSANLLWCPLPVGWEMDTDAPKSSPFEIPHQVLQHHAILLRGDGAPFSELIETYTSDVLAGLFTRSR
jgi:chorismate-pyruvate lyase